MTSGREMVLVPSSSQQGHYTALHRAAKVGNSEALAALIKGGCALDLQDRDGNTALHEVSWHGFSQCVKLLVKAGANNHARNKAGNIPLHLACQNAHAQSSRILLLGGSRPDTKNNVGDTCLHVAARYNHLAIGKILLGALCSVTEKNQVGDTALHVAAALNHKNTVQLLLEAGTDGNVRNNAGKTALDKARDQNHREVTLLLARAPQVHRFTRGRTVRKRRDGLKAQRRTQSATRVEILPNKDSGSLAEDSHSSECVVSTGVIKSGLHPLQHYHKASAAPASPHGRRRRRKHLRVPVSDEGSPKRRENTQTQIHRRNKLSLFDDEAPLPPGDTAYQLYTLYRDKDGHIRQAPADGCHCKPMIKKLEVQLKATKKEMRTHILTVQEQVDCRLDRMDNKCKHQIQVLDMLIQERVAAERMRTMFRMDQRAAGRVEAERRQQVSVSQELKRWCMTKIHDIDCHAPGDPQYSKLLTSPSVDQSLTDQDPESLPLLSVFSGESSSSLATYVNLLPYKSGSNIHNAPLSPDSETVSRSKYFELKLDRSPDDYENSAVFSQHPLHQSRLLLSATDPQRSHQELQHYPMAGAIVRQNGEDCSSSVSSSLSVTSDWDRDHQGLEHQGYSWHHKMHLRDPIRTCGMAAGPQARTRTLEFFGGRPPEPTFSQERSNLHAVEVTQRFFETVSTQLECWYERKLQESKQQAHIQAQQDRSQLIQRINSLEEELQQLRANSSPES
ncbi:ankyrin repeat domain-containing protein 6 [Hypomesus transpacificus]|uniref:ankyrin repeat domain-containing protein 6 n=1 Tax=Hypomesus transpacificus TaxID=137520 RepID=UPI001F08194B|nr:ankyrin repeat domain-containing protein 6 [Hypomesus transpacificus]